jgi:hypothetical protein
MTGVAFTDVSEVIYLMAMRVIFAILACQGRSGHLPGRRKQ